MDNCKAIFMATTTKREALRLMFLFPNAQEMRGFAGRSEGMHKNQLMFAEANPNAPHLIAHKFGRSVRSAPTTNGSTYELEYSLAVAKMGPEEMVFIDVRPHKSPRAWIFCIRPTTSFRPCDAFRIKILTNEVGRGSVRIATDTRHFDIRQDGITEKAWAVWEEDKHKFDACHHFDGEKTISTDHRTPWLASLAAGETAIFEDANGNIINTHE